VLIAAKKGVLLKVLRFSYFIEVLANTITAEANIYKAKLKNIFNYRSVMIVKHECKQCAIVNDPNSARNLQWFNVNTSDTNWT
jgi:hypothetical protein